MAAQDNKLLVAVTSQFPPYTVDHKAQTGIDPELIAGVLNRMGYEVEFLPTPSKRQDSIASRQEVDATTGWFNDFLPGCHKAKPYRYWYNALIVPENSDIKSVEDLANKRVAVFDGADRFIDGYTEFMQEVAYITVADSSIQAARMIKANRVDAYIGDYVGYYYAIVAYYDEDMAKKLTKVRKYFNLNTQKICFKDKTIRDAFDKTLDELIDEQIYERVYSKYSPGIENSLYPGRAR
jgi:hypothetical protein